MLFCAEGTLRLETPDAGATLAARDAWRGVGSGQTWRLAATDEARVYLIEILEADRDMTSTLPLDEFRAIVGADGVRVGAALDSVDKGWDPANLDAGVMVRPRAAHEVSAILRVCDRAGIGVVPHGGRTGLVGGGVSRPGEIILSLDRMNRIARLDPLERVAVVEAGVTLEALQSAAAAHGLEPGIDLPARGTATIGGMASTNAGGVMAFRNGVMRHRVLAWRPCYQTASSTMI